jgi:hypothetical protein
VATFDQLPADQRAIIELVLKRGRTYDALSEMLGMPTSRVRDLARDALTELAPVSAERVDPDWRAQVADYVLGQQSGPESAATQGHLRRSESARAWLLSLMDSLDQLYANGTRPELPEPDGERPRARDRKAGRERSVTPVGAKDADADAGVEKDAKGDKGPSPSPLSGGREGGPLSPAARTVVMRRRITGGILALAVLVLAVLLLTGTLGGGDKGKDNTSAQSDQPATTAAAGQPTQLVGQVELKPVGRLAEKDTAGFAAIALTGSENQLAIRAKLPPSTTNEAYEVWLFNSRDDAVSVGAQKTDAQGNYEGAGKIPADYKKYKYIDVSLEKIDRNRAHSGKSILRAALADLQAPPAQPQAGAGGGTGTGTTP